MNTEQILGKKIKIIRTIRGWSIEELAEKALLGTTTIAYIERAISSPTLDTVEKIANAFGMPIHEMLNFDDVEKFL